MESVAGAAMTDAVECGICRDLVPPDLGCTVAHCVKREAQWRAIQRIGQRACWHCMATSAYLSLCVDGHYYCDGCLSCISD